MRYMYVHLSRNITIGHKQNEGHLSLFKVKIYQEYCEAQATFKFLNDSDVSILSTNFVAISCVGLVKGKTKIQ